MQALELRAEAADWDDGPLQPEPNPRARLQLVDGPPPATPPWQDKLQAVPAMCSALVPLDEGEEGSWSKPFSLVKADFEPWLSYYAGYCSSRLFQQGGHGAGAGRPEPDFPVRALLALRQINPLLIIEPPVRIDGPVEYFDASRAPRAGRDRGVQESLARAADAMHRSQLRRARERGQELGNILYDALLGEGLANLIHAWEKLHGRKPNAHELHLMLTTGRITPVKPPEPTTPTVASAPPVPRAPAAPAAPAARSVEQRNPPSSAPAVPPAMPDWAKQSAAAAAVPASVADEQTGRPAWHYLIHLAGAAGLGAMIYILIA